MTQKKLKILILGGSWFRIIEHPLQRLGHDVVYFEIEEDTLTYGKLKALDQLLSQNRPDFAVIQNFYAFEFHPIHGRAVEEIVSKHNLPVAAWYLDNPQSSGTLFTQSRWYSGHLPPNFLYFCVDRAHQVFFQMRKLPSVHLPIAADDRLREFIPDKRIGNSLNCDISFIGRPAFKTLVNPQSEEDLKTTFEGHLLEEIFQLLQAHPLFKPREEALKMVSIVERELTPFFNCWIPNSAAYILARNLLFTNFRNSLPKEVYEVLLCYIGRFDYSYSHYQMSIYLKRLVGKGLKLYGGESWKNFISEYESPTPRLEDHEMNTLFSSSKINFCYTKFQFMGAVHERPVLILACGGFPLTDQKDELYELFETDEVAAYTSPEHALELVDFYLEHVQARQKIIQKGRAKVFAKHTYYHRMQTMVEAAATHWGL